MSFKADYQRKKEIIDSKLQALTSNCNDCPKDLLESIRYSLLAGGKRLRPILLLAANDLFGPVNEHTMAMACAVEMIHTYSLIHDDLPAMDNDNYRRGKLTSHKKFGEAMAILTGDALLNLAYETMLENLPVEAEQGYRYLKAMTVIAKAAGMSGMVGGQVVDVNNESNKDISFDSLEYIHRHKTGALIKASLHAGVLLNTDDKSQIQAILSYGESIGLAFQITDDILDVTGSRSNIGKEPGSDALMGKKTYPDRFGLEASKKMARDLIDEAVSSIDCFGNKSSFLMQLAHMIVDRTS